MPPIVRAFVLIVVDPARTSDVYEQLKKVPAVVELYQVMGPYDLIAVIQSHSLADVPSIIGKSIRSVAGIEGTTTCVTFPEAELSPAG